MVIVTVDAPKAKVIREPRRQLHKQPAWMTVDDGVTNRECFVLDVSPGGARIVTELPETTLRTLFAILLFGVAAQLVWRTRRGNPRYPDSP